jgi:hypothetical protein
VLALHSEAQKGFRALQPFGAPSHTPLDVCPVLVAHRRAMIPLGALEAVSQTDSRVLERTKRVCRAKGRMDELTPLAVTSEGVQGPFFQTAVFLLGMRG